MVSVYNPNPLYIPEGTSIERVAPPHTNDANEPFDRRGIFYDLIVSRDRKTIHCVGPPFFNLGHPKEAYLGRRKLTLSVYEPTHLTTTRAAITSIACPALRVGEEHSLRLVFDRFEATHTIDVKEHPLCEPTNFTISTLQKDNDPQWIKDWCIWNYHKHGVGRIVIYDNGSANLDQLQHTLSEIEPELILVPWNHPFGPFALKFAQTTALNHCRLLFARDSHWCINLDVDEYLQSDSDLASVLDRRACRRRAIVYLRGYTVPFLVDGKPARCYDSDVRYREFARERKYIYQPTKTLLAEVHSAIEIHRPLYGIWLRCRRVMMRTLNKAPSLKTAIRRVAYGIVNLANLIRDRGHSTARLQKTGGYLLTPGDELFFFHFRALNTGWKIPRRIVEVDEQEVVVDSRIKAMRSVIDPPCRATSRSSSIDSVCHWRETTMGRP